MAETDNKIFWGLYVIDFAFFIGLSHAGPLDSALLRIAGARWRAPIARMAEFIGVPALMVGGLLPIIDLGQPGRLPPGLRRPRCPRLGLPLPEYGPSLPAR